MYLVFFEKIFRFVVFGERNFKLIGPGKHDVVTGIIAAGGQGTRLGQAGGKQLLNVADKPVAAWAVDALARAQKIRDIIVVCDPNRVDEYEKLIRGAVSTRKRLKFIPGGDSRRDSVVAGLVEALDSDVVVIHDGARPLLDSKAVDSALEYFFKNIDVDGVVLGNQAVDTLKQVESGKVADTPDRRKYWHAQTPQIFARDYIFDCYVHANDEGFQGTDDASYCEYAGGTVVMAPSSRNNIKVTTPEDVDFVEHMLRKGAREC